MPQRAARSETGATGTNPSCTGRNSSRSWDLGRGKGLLQCHQQVHPAATAVSTEYSLCCDSHHPSDVCLCTKPHSHVRNKLTGQRDGLANSGIMGPLQDPGTTGTVPGKGREKAPSCPGAVRQWQIWFSSRGVQLHQPPARPSHSNKGSGCLIYQKRRTKLDPRVDLRFRKVNVCPRAG